MIGNNSTLKSTTGHFNSETTLNQPFKSTYVQMRDPVPIYRVVTTRDQNFDDMTVNFSLVHGAPTSAQDAPIGLSTDFRVSVLYPVGGGFFRSDRADAGSVTYAYDDATQTLKATLAFEVFARGETPGYKFFNGDLQIEGVDPCWLQCPE